MTHAGGRRHGLPSGAGGEGGGQVEVLAEVYGGEARAGAEVEVAAEGFVPRGAGGRLGEVFSGDDDDDVLGGRGRERALAERWPRVELRQGASVNGAPGGVRHHRRQVAPGAASHVQARLGVGVRRDGVGATVHGRDAALGEPDIDGLALGHDVDVAVVRRALHQGRRHVRVLEFPACPRRHHVRFCVS